MLAWAPTNAKRYIIEGLNHLKETLDLKKNKINNDVHIINKKLLQEGDTGKNLITEKLKNKKSDEFLVNQTLVGLLIRFIRQEIPSFESQEKLISYTYTKINLSVNIENGIGATHIYKCAFGELKRSKHLSGLTNLRNTIESNDCKIVIENIINRSCKDFNFTKIKLEIQSAINKLQY